MRLGPLQPGATAATAPEGATPIGRRSLMRAAALGATTLAALGGPHSPADARTVSGDGLSGRRLPLIIDVHAHPPMPALLESLRRADPGGRAVVGGSRVLADWTPALGIEVMDTHGIEAMVMSSPFVLHGISAQESLTLTRRVNDEMADVIARHPRRFGAFAMLPLADVDASLAEMTRALDQLGFDGVCLLTNVDGAYLGEKRFWPLFAELNRRKSVAFVHPAEPAYLSSLALKFDPSLMEFMIDSNRSAASVIFSGLRQAYPDFTYISTHGGGTIPYLVHRFETGVLATAAYGLPMSPADIRQGFQSLHYELTAATSASTISSLLEMVDTSRVMLGFDYPVRPTALIEPSRAELAASRFLDNADLTAIARANALRLLPALARRVAGPAKGR